MNATRDMDTNEKRIGRSRRMKRQGKKKKGRFSEPFSTRPDRIPRHAGEEGFPRPGKTRL